MIELMPVKPKSCVNIVRSVTLSQLHLIYFKLLSCVLYTKDKFVQNLNAQ